MLRKNFTIRKNNLGKMSLRHAIGKVITILMILFFNQKLYTTALDVQPMGSILFEDHGFVKKCFVQNDIALMATRMKFQELLPIGGDHLAMTDDGIQTMINYLYSINEVIERISQDDIKQLIQKSFYDLLGR